MIVGIGASDGIVFGKIYKYVQTDLVIEKESVTDTASEIEKLHEALKVSETELQDLKGKAEKSMDKETAAILGAHIEILNDPEISFAVSAKINGEHVNADYAFKEVTDKYVAMFESMDNEYFSERTVDIKDVAKRVLIHLQGLETFSFAEIKEEVIVLAKDLTPSDTAQLNKRLVKGFITGTGGRTSHSAIMARTLEIPAVVGAKQAYDELENGDLVILNGHTGEVLVKPTQEEIDACILKIENFDHQKALWQQFKDNQSLTKDGKRLQIGGNIGKPEDLEGVINSGGECIGLYRTEFLYMERSDYPNEDEQYNAYKSVLEGLKGKPVVVRTLDIGGDKQLNYLKIEHELNPFLGNRGLRLCLNMPDIFKTQLRALLRASVYGELHIMFPMVATICELRKAKEFVANIHKELLAEGHKVRDSYKIGIMIEIPAAAVIADALAKEVDFFSIGTNDLIQYLFAADRMNGKVSYLYQPFNPALLRLISMVIKAAHKEGKWVGLCGEMAGDMKALPLLIGLGLDEFSMSAPSILKIRYLAVNINTKEAGGLAEAALECDSQTAVLELVDTYLKKIGWTNFG